MESWWSKLEQRLRAAICRCDIVVIMRTCNFLLLLFAASRSPALGQEPWQKSWDKFLDKMTAQGSLPENSILLPNVAEFLGKEVLWEGAIGEVTDVKSQVHVQMPTSRKVKGPGGKVALADWVQPKLKAASFGEWKQIPKGTKVKFKATVPQLVFFAFYKEVATGNHMIIFDLEEAEPVK